METANGSSCAEMAQIQREKQMEKFIDVLKVE